MQLRMLLMISLLWLPRVARADLILAVDIGVADPVFIGTTPNDLQTGFQGLNGAPDFALSTGDQSNPGTAAIVSSFGGLTVSLQAPAVNGGLVFDDAAEINAPLGDLVEEYFWASGTDIVIDIDGLGPGDYEMTTWHHWANPQFGADLMDIVVSDQADAGATTVASNVQWSSGTTGPFTSETFAFTLAPGSDLRVRVASVGGSITGLNGFSLSAVPEPSTLGLTGFASLLLLWRRRNTGLIRV